jgi:hypothetical protein
MESYNAILIGQGKTMSERIVLLRELAVKQMETLSMVSMDGIKQLPGGDSKRVTKLSFDYAERIGRDNWKNGKNDKDANS